MSAGILFIVLVIIGVWAVFLLRSGMYSDMSPKGEEIFPETQKETQKPGSEELEESEESQEDILVSGEQNAKNLEECKAIDSIFERDNCYNDLAVEKQDIVICNEIRNCEYDGKKDKCYADIAIAKQDTEVCKYVQDKIYQSLCVKTIKNENLSPEEAAARFLRWYMYDKGNLEMKKSDNSAVDVTDGYKQKIAREWGKNMSVPGGCDPVLFAQNFPGSIEIGDASIIGKTAFLDVNLEFAAPHILEVEFLLVDNKWKINNVQKSK